MGIEEKVGAILSKAETESLQYSMTIAVEWLIEYAQKKEENLTFEKNSHKLEHSYWKGAIRGEYSFATGEWDFFCPVWHTGQALKALALAYPYIRSNDVLDAALLAVNFIIRNTDRKKDSDDFGLIHAYEDRGDGVNISAIMETLDGLFEFADLLSNLRDNASIWDHLKDNDVLNDILIYERENGGDEWQYTEFDKYLRTIALDALEWCSNKAYIQEEGIFWDAYIPKQKKLLGSRKAGVGKGRPLVEDSVFLKGYKISGKTSYLDAFKGPLQTLVLNERPPGNWIKYPPANEEKGFIHPRHAYWWGRPFIAAFREFRDPAYLMVAIRSANWYMTAMRHDGGIIRNTYVDFNSDSFGHATSGSAAGAILMTELIQLLSENSDVGLDARKIIEESHMKPYEVIRDLGLSIKKALSFCQMMQLTMPDDEKWYGCVIEKVHSPRGSERNPMHIRDLGTIFYIQAAARVLGFLGK